MGLIYDDPDLAALTLTRLAAEDAEGPGGLEGRMLDYPGQTLRGFSTPRK
jgi:hypothetical protein